MASRARNRWRGRVFLPSGSERTKLFDTKREALAWEAANRGRPVETNETLAAYIKRTRDQVLHGLSASTAATYRSHLVRRIEPELGHRKMAKIHTGHVETAAAEWSRSGVSSSVVVGTLNCLSRFYRHAIKSEALSVNPVQAAERPRPDPARTVPTLTAAEVDAVVARCAAVNGLYGDYVWSVPEKVEA